MKKLIYILTAAFVLASCTEAADELTELDLGKVLRPISITFSGITADSVLVSWKGTANHFTLEYSTSQSFESNVIAIENIESTSAQVRDLIEQTYYFFRVKGFSANADIEPSEWSAVFSARTQLDVKIPNVAATDIMEYTMSPFTITSTVTVTWGAPGVEAEELTLLRMTPDVGEPLEFALNPLDCAAQTKAVSEGVQTSTHYTISLINAAGKNRGTTEITTKAGPTPTITATPSLDLTSPTNKAKVKVVWTLYYVEASTLLRVDIEQGSSVATTASIEAADIINGYVEIDNLGTETTYTAKLYNTSNEIIAQANFTTPKGLSANVRVVETNEELGEVITNRTVDSLYLLPGTYEMTTNGVVSRNLVLYAEDPSQTTVNSTKPLVASGTLDRIVLQKLKFALTVPINSYVIQIAATGAFDITSILIDSCYMDLSGITANATLLSNGSVGTDTYHLGTFTLRNSLVRGNTVGGQQIVMHLGSTSKMAFDAINITNNTITCFGRGILGGTTAANADFGYTITVDHNTFYKANATNNGAYLFDPMAGGSASKSITVTNNIVHFAATTQFRWLRVTTSPSTPTINFSNNLAFEGQTALWGSSAYTQAATLTYYTGALTTLWTNPQDNPFVGVFKVKDADILQAMGIVGDTNW